MASWIFYAMNVFWSRKYWKKQSLKSCLFCFCKTFLKPLMTSKALVQYQNNQDRHHAMEVLMLFASTKCLFFVKVLNSCLDVRELFKKHKKKSEWICGEHLPRECKKDTTWQAPGILSSISFFSPRIRPGFFRWITFWPAKNDMSLWLGSNNNYG